MKSKAVSLLLTGVLIAGLAACGGAGEKGGNAAEATDSPAAGSKAEAVKGENKGTVTDSPEQEIVDTAGTTITVMCSQDWVEDAERELGLKFEEETGIHVDYQIVPADQYQDQLLMRLNNGEGPDIWGAQSGFALSTTYNVTENAVDLSNEDWADAYSPFSAEQTGVGGVNYGMTYYDTTTDYYMVYNKKLFEAAGATVPTTWDEFISVCEKLSASGVTPIYEPIVDGWHVLLLWTENAQVYDHTDPRMIDRLNKNEISFEACANMKKALDQMNELAKKGYFGENYMSDEFADAEGYLASGEYAMCMLKTGAIKTIVNSDLNTNGYTEDDFGLFILPIVDNQYLNIHPTGPSRFIYSGSKHIDEAKQYLSFIARKESVQYMIDNSDEVENLPLEVGQTPEYSKTTREFLDGFDDEHSGMVLQDVVLYFNEQWMEINADISAMFEGDMTSSEVLKGIDERRAQLAQAAGDPNWN
ncbi:MAG: extracellular solute-binding protein [Lachnospiraceae bacterium]|nr:extracellular solute-binding protein [Lachnospiraceae bacterium]